MLVLLVIIEKALNLVRQKKANFDLNKATELYLDQVTVTSKDQNPVVPIIVPRCWNDPKINSFPYEKIKLNATNEKIKLAKWSLDVKRNHSFTCLISNSNRRGDRLESHHLYSKKTYPKLKFSILNGIPIALRFHQEFHQKYG